MRIAILAGQVRGHGRSKALLSTADALAQQHAVRVYPDADSWAFKRLTEWHGFTPDVTWRPGGEPDAAAVTIAWAKPRAGHPDASIAWVESGSAPAGVDAVWCPSQAVAEGMAVPACVVYPTHYFRHLPDPTERDRDIDVLVHGRKAGGVSDRFEPGVNVVTSGSFTHAALIERYERAKIFVHPKRDRPEPLGLMPLEAARYGCRVFLPDDSGAAELLPDAAHTDPVAAAAEYLTPRPA